MAAKWDVPGGAGKLLKSTIQQCQARQQLPPAIVIIRVISGRAKWLSALTHPKKADF
jgi:hypothetical protein